MGDGLRSITSVRNCLGYGLGDGSQVGGRGGLRWKNLLDGATDNSLFQLGCGLRDGLLPAGRRRTNEDAAVGEQWFIPRGRNGLRHGLRNGRGYFVRDNLGAGFRRRGVVLAGGVDGTEEVHDRNVRGCSSIGGSPETRRECGGGGFCLIAACSRQGERSGIDGRNRVDCIKWIQRNLFGDGLWNRERNGLE